MSKPTNPHVDPLGPERHASPDAKRASARSSSVRLSRLDEEVERVRRSPTPTQGT